MHAGEVADIIYQNRQGVLSKRRIRVIHVDAARIKAYCFFRRCVRTFTTERILAFQKVVGREKGFGRSVPPVWRKVLH